MSDFLDEFNLSKEVMKKLKNPEHIKKEIAEGKSAQDILEYSDATMKKFYQAAHKLLEHQRYPAAANAFLFLVTLNPYQYEYWLGLGMASQMCQEYEVAINAYEMAATCKIDNPFPYFYLAKCLFAMHDRESALMAIDLALEYADQNDEYIDLIRQALAAKKILLGK